LKCGIRATSNAALQVNFFRWNARFFCLNFANGSLEYQEQEGRGEFYGELFFSKDSAVEKQGAFSERVVMGSAIINLLNFY
jgi:hypothetical protein